MGNVVSQSSSTREGAETVVASDSPNLALPTRRASGRRFALVIAIWKYEGLADLAGLKELQLQRQLTPDEVEQLEKFGDLTGPEYDAKNAKSTLKDLKFDVTCMAEERGTDEAGVVTYEHLEQKAKAWLKKLAEAAKNCEELDVLLVVAGHGIQPASSRQAFPHVVASCRKPYDCGQLIEELAQIKCRRGGVVEIVYVFDVCRFSKKVWPRSPCTNVYCLTADPPCDPRGDLADSSPHGSGSRTSWYAIFSADPGRWAKDKLKEHSLICEVMDLLRYEIPVTDVLEQAAHRLNMHLNGAGRLAPRASCQRPWVECSRRGLYIPIFGTKPWPQSSAPTPASRTSEVRTAGGELTAVLAGCPGSGKTTIGRLFDLVSFKPYDGVSPKVAGGVLSWGVSLGAGKDQLWTLMEPDWERFVNFTDGPVYRLDVVLLCLRLPGGRFISQHCEVLKELVHKLGPEVLEHTIPVVSSMTGELVDLEEDEGEWLTDEAKGWWREVAKRAVIVGDLSGAENVEDTMCCDARAELREKMEAMVERNRGQKYMGKQLADGEGPVRRHREENVGSAFFPAVDRRLDDLASRLLPWVLTVVAAGAAIAAARRRSSGR